MNGRAGLCAVLLVIGTLWGVTVPLTKIAVTAGHPPLGLIFWQMALGGGLLWAVCLARGRGLSFRRHHVALFAMIALVGTILPNSASYPATFHLPSGVVSILISTVPLMAFPIAMWMGTDRFSWPRLLGLALGFAAIVLIALPQTSLPERAMVAFLPLALIAPAFYALEGNLVARFGTFGLDAMQVLAGASLLGASVIGPAAWVSGSFVPPSAMLAPSGWAIPLIAVAHASAYSGYVWLVGRAGAVFASQVAYVVTGTGIFWAWLILSETYSGWVWAALMLMFAGLFLVLPRGGSGGRDVQASGPRRPGEAG